MSSYKHPGVYIEELPSGSLAIEVASTSTAAIIGPVQRGPVNQPVLVTRLDEFSKRFGVLGDNAGGIRDLGDETDHFGHAVNAFFMNGGRRAYIVRVSDGTEGYAQALLAHPEENEKALRLTARSPGRWANGMVVQLEPVDNDSSLGYELSLGYSDDDQFNAIEIYSGVFLDPAHGRFVGAQLRDSELVKTVEIVDVAPGEADTGTATFEDGADSGTALTAHHYQGALTELEDCRDASILLLPGVHYGVSGKESIIDAAITHAEKMKNRMVIVDPEPNTKLTTQKAVKDAGFTNSPHAALYYPWLKTPNPHYHPETAANRPLLVEIAPSAVAAGVWARIDGRRGVWKAPAGLDTGVRGVTAPKYVVSNDVQDSLNEWGVNCIRDVAGTLVVWGARTLATRAMPDFRYVSVRRTSILIGESLYNALQAVVFEPNNHTLWASLRANVSGFMDTLWRAGAFQGAKASEAYHVSCGLGDAGTMTQEDINAGIVRVKVAYAPLKPAEFVVIQIQQKVGQSAG